jgi:hypothetical protein
LPFKPNGNALHLEDWMIEPLVEKLKKLPSDAPRKKSLRVKLIDPNCYYIHVNLTIKGYRLCPDWEFKVAFKPERGNMQPCIPKGPKGHKRLVREAVLVLMTHLFNLQDPQLPYLLSNKIQQTFCVPDCDRRIVESLVEILQQYAPHCLAQARLDSHDRHFRQINRGMENLSLGNVNNSIRLDDMGGRVDGHDRYFRQINRGMENLSIENVNHSIRLDDNECRLNRIQDDTEYLQIQACHEALGIEELQERADRSDGRHGHHETRLGHHETRLGHHETRLDTLDEETLGMRRQIKQHAGEIADTNEILAFQDARLDSHDEQLHGIKEWKGGLEKRLANIPELDLGQALQVWKRLRLNPNQQSMELVEPFDRSTITVQVNMLEARGDENSPQLVVKLEDGAIVPYVPLGPEGNKKLATLMNEMRHMAILDHTTKLLKMEQAISKKYYIVAIKDRMRAIDDRKRRQESEELRARRFHAP